MEHTWQNGHEIAHWQSVLALPPLSASGKVAEAAFGCISAASVTLCCFLRESFDFLKDIWFEKWQRRLSRA